MGHVVNVDIQMHRHSDSYSGTEEVLFLETRRHLAGLPFLSDVSGETLALFFFG
jgi:hypothetical protein